MKKKSSAAKTNSSTGKKEVNAKSNSINLYDQLADEVKPTKKSSKTTKKSVVSKASSKNKKMTKDTITKANIKKKAITTSDSNSVYDQLLNGTKITTNNNKKTKQNNAATIKSKATPKAVRPKTTNNIKGEPVNAAPLNKTQTNKKKEEPVTSVTIDAIFQPNGTEFKFTPVGFEWFEEAKSNYMKMFSKQSEFYDTMLKSLTGGKLNMGNNDSVEKLVKTMMNSNPFGKVMMDMLYSFNKK